MTEPVNTAPAPVVAPEAVPVAAPAVAPAPVETAPVASVAPVVAPTEVITPTVLTEAIDKAAEPVVVTETPKDPAVVETAAPAVKEGGQSDEPAPPPSYDSFTLPEGVTLAEGRVKEFTDILSNLETKAKGIDHALVQEFGQKAVDFHLQETQRTIEQIITTSNENWERQKTEWKDQFMNDPSIGGKVAMTTVNDALSFIRTHGGTAEEQQEFRDVMETSGLGNHRAVIRLLANASRAMREGQPLAATTPVPAQAKSKLEAMYGKSK